MTAVGIIIQSEDEKSILLAKRSMNEEDEQGKWENIGGKLEENETFEEAVIREAKEELDINVSELEEVLEYGGENEKNHIKVFKVKFTGEPKLLETDMCDEIKWFKITELNNLDLAKYTKEDFKRLGWIT